MIVFLDQNKWIALARAAKYPGEDPEARAILELLCRECQAGRVLLPLTTANVYETHKINNAQRRAELAYCMTTLSRASFFRGRRRRLEVEIIDAVRNAYGLLSVQQEKNWFLSNLFFETSAEWDDPRMAESGMNERFVAAVRQNPQSWLFRYLTETPESVRTTAVQRFTAGSDELRRNIEDVRRRNASETLSMRRRIMNARMMINELDLIQTLVARAGVPNVSVKDILEKHARRIMNETPTYVIEREIGLRIEAQQRPIEENDFRDMDTFSAVLAYADVVVAENQFVNLARQAGLDRRFCTAILCDLSELKNHIA